MNRSCPAALRECQSLVRLSDQLDRVGPDPSLARYDATTATATTATTKTRRRRNMIRCQCLWGVASGTPGTPPYPVIPKVGGDTLPPNSRTTAAGH
ncbi:hypothetical protein AND_000732 [Anopheles darlingi]|uniref:Uncharacterized protein n=1 Tax=Anopheles darlingi TaxID=43151 RepID=W5JVN4_ANODA|nr:hypothetical protein AND_000732 [Anopheles darlingi]